MWYREGKMYFP